MNETIEKSYELRDLQSKDMFPMFKIISKIGIKEFKSCFESEEVKQLIKGGSKKIDMKAVGVVVVLDVTSIVLSHVADCEQEIYQLLSQLSGMKKDDVASLSMAEFTSMIIDVFKQDGFMDFIQVVSGLFK